MPNVIEGRLVCPDGRFAVVVSRFNEFVTERLVEGAVATILRHGGSDDAVDVVRVPGAFEIPVVAQRLASSKKYVAVVCLGAVIQGATSHNEYINSQVAAGIMAASRETGVPITFGVITCQSMEQAVDRAGGKVGNKGEEAALAAIEVVNLLAKL